jgi:hypothetical protein
MSYENLVDVAWRFHRIGVLTGEILGWVSLLGGFTAFGLAKRHSSWNRRSRGLISGGAGALASALLIDEVYNFVKYLMIEQTGSVEHKAVLYPQELLDAIGSNGFELVSLAGVIAQFGAVFGMASFAFGAGLWGVTSERSRFHSSATRILYTGVALMAVSVAERALAAMAFVFASAL